MSTDYQEEEILSQLIGYLHSPIPANLKDALTTLEKMASYASEEDSKRLGAMMRARGGLVQLGFIAADPNHPREIVEQAKYLQKAFDLGASSPGLPAPTGSVFEVANHIATAELEVEQLRQRLAAANQELETFTTTTTQQTPLAILDVKRRQVRPSLLESAINTQGRAAYRERCVVGFCGL